ncbi:vWA domain-containing protein [Methanobrevibacter ruminantium]|nr:vWA domain-containing protein [Methanobrevibacter ruminantium]
MMRELNMDEIKNAEKIESFDQVSAKLNKTEKEEIVIDEMDIVFLLDKSGSMFGIIDDTLGGFNSFIKREKEKEVKTRVTLVLFDHKYKVLYTRKPIEEVEELTEEDYYADGCTALLDAIGTTINRIEKEVCDEVLFVITTDGLENYSKEYSREDVKKLIRSHNWNFIFIGADIDSYEEAASLGIPSTRSANYEKSRRGVGSLYRSVSYAKRLRSSGESLDKVNWKRGLD